MAETVNDYVNLEENETKEEQKPKAKRKLTQSKKKESQKEAEIDPEVQSEISRKRDILASVAMTLGLEEYVGENISAVDIRKMKDSDLECLFKVYEEKSGQELMKDGMGIVVDGIFKGLSYILTLDDEESLKKDLLNNKQLGRRICRYASKVSEEKPWKISEIG